MKTVGAQLGGQEGQLEGGGLVSMWLITPPAPSSETFPFFQRLKGCRELKLFKH